MEIYTSYRLEEEHEKQTYKSQEGIDVKVSIFRQHNTEYAKVKDLYWFPAFDID